MKGISNPSDLEQVIHVGNERYSSLSQLARQSYLLLTELPTMLSYQKIITNWNTVQAIVVESIARSPLRTFKGYEYCVGFKRTFESLKSEKYRSFILATIAFVYSPNNEHFKVFDTHARDIYGKSHSQGTCVLLDISSKHYVVQYFQNVYGMTELCGVKGFYKVIYRNSFRGIFVSLLLITDRSRAKTMLIYMYDLKIGIFDTNSVSMEE